MSKRVYFCKKDKKMIQEGNSNIILIKLAKKYDLATAQKAVYKLQIKF